MQLHRHTNTQTDIQTHKQTDIQTHKQTDIQTHKQTDIQTYTQACREDTNNVHNTARREKKVRTLKIYKGRIPFEVTFLSKPLKPLWHQEESNPYPVPLPLRGGEFRGDWGSRSWPRFYIFALQHFSEISFDKTKSGATCCCCCCCLQLLYVIMFYINYKDKHKIVSLVRNSYACDWFSMEWRRMTAWSCVGLVKEKVLDTAIIQCFSSGICTTQGSH